MTEAGPAPSRLPAEVAASTSAHPTPPLAAVPWLAPAGPTSSTLCLTDAPAGACSPCCGLCLWPAPEARAFARSIAALGDVAPIPMPPATGRRTPCPPSRVMGDGSALRGRLCVELELELAQERGLIRWPERGLWVVPSPLARRAGNGLAGGIGAGWDGAGWTSPAGGIRSADIPASGLLSAASLTSTARACLPAALGLTGTGAVGIVVTSTSSAWVATSPPSWASGERSPAAPPRSHGSAHTASAVGLVAAERSSSRSVSSDAGWPAGSPSALALGGLVRTMRITSASESPRNGKLPVSMR
mmetsp:Transcript_18664/g.70900  ORF Transcript_18664/g.70900 Transcript_18664/m.70900 type:complete len:302 (-) Transcript_18664:1793-2698(-)